MLQLKHLKKTYHVGDTSTHALDDVSLSFRDHEFVAILGPSGSGKTTLLNVIGGLDRYDSGDMIINGTSTKAFKETDWDAYRNNSVGFIFQSYNLITHLSIIANVELGMTLSGVSAQQRHEKAIAALTRVGLKEHLHKKINQLSGGQMQRVAIARAIANDPDILLCDEPTGALDSETSIQIMKLIKELSRDRLVIMVTHNPELAKVYATRLVHFKDGEIIDDNDPFNDVDQKATFELKRTKMSYWNALKLSMTNILTKKGRTFLTAFASSIGIIGIAVVLSLSNGFQKQIDDTQNKTLAKFPISIAQTASDPDAAKTRKESTKNIKSHGYLIAQKDQREEATHQNRITSSYVSYVRKINPKYADNLAFLRATQLNLIRKNGNRIQRVQFSNAGASSLLNMQSQAISSIGISSSVFPESLKKEKHSFLQQNYQLLSGAWPKKKTDVILVVDNKNQTNLNGLKNLGLNVKSGQHLSFDSLIGKTFKIVDNDHYYTKLPTGQFVPSALNEKMYDQSSLNVRLVGVIRAKNASNMALLATGIAYSDGLSKMVIKENQDSAIVKAQKSSSVNVITGQSLKKTDRSQVLAALGASNVPSTIMIYPNNFDDKDKILDYLDRWNHGKTKTDKIIYTDMSGTVTQLTGGLLTAITDVLVAFAAISLVTAMIMIGILTYTSVLERTKEIGVLKALGARKRDITRVFDAETFILGVLSGALGILIAYLLTFPINHVLEGMTDMTNIAVLNPVHALLLIVISTILTLIGGHLPARIAAKKDAAIALRTE